VSLTRRPFPHTANSIGNWFTILQIISFMGVFVNAGLIVFTANVFGFEDGDVLAKLVAYFIIDHFLLLSKTLISWLVPDENYEFCDSKLWQKRIVDERLYLKFADIDKQRKLRKLTFVGE
jgi:hypothetical protein